MSDRHFDQLATRFAEKIYGGAKGAIRLAVLQADLAEALPDRRMRVLDIGGGLGHMSLWLAERGHDVTFTEPAEPMLEGARQRFAEAGQTATFIQAPWQELPGQLDMLLKPRMPQSLIMCHIKQIGRRQLIQSFMQFSRTINRTAKGQINIRTTLIITLCPGTINFHPVYLRKIPETASNQLQGLFAQAKHQDAFSIIKSCNCCSADI